MEDKVARNDTLGKPYGDNQCALKLATNSVRHTRTKHFEIEHHFIREKVLDETIKVLEVRRNDKFSDIFT